MKKFMISVNGNSYEVDVSEVISSGRRENFMSERNDCVVRSNKGEGLSTMIKVNEQEDKVVEGALSISAPISGRIVEINVKIGDKVKSNDVLCWLESMKLENEIIAPQEGIIVAIHVEKNDSVNLGDILFSIE